MKKKGIKISPLFFLPCFLIWLCCDWTFTLGYIAAIILHEYSHVYAAKIMGYDNAVIKLGIYGCQGEIPELDYCGAGSELAIACVGPAFNLLAAVLLALLSQVFYRYYYTFMAMATGNFLLGAFNLLPVLPLDGGRILRSLLCLFVPKDKATRLCGRLSVFTGTAILTAFAYYAVYGQYKVFLLVLGIFIILGAINEMKKSGKNRMGFMLRDRELNCPKKIVRYAVSCEEDLRTALAYFNDDCFNVVDVVSTDGTISKTLTETELKKEFLK